MFVRNDSPLYLSLVVTILTLGLVDVEALLVVGHLCLRHVKRLTGFLTFEVWRGVTVWPGLLGLDLVSPVAAVFVVSPVIAAPVITVAAVTITPGLRGAVIIIVIIVIIILPPSGLTEMRTSESMRKYNAMSLRCC